MVFHAQSINHFIHPIGTMLESINFDLFLRKTITIQILIIFKKHI